MNEWLILSEDAKLSQLNSEIYWDDSELIQVKISYPANVCIGLDQKVYVQNSNFDPHAFIRLFSDVASRSSIIDLLLFDVKGIRFPWYFDGGLSFRSNNATVKSNRLISLTDSNSVQYMSCRGLAARICPLDGHTDLRDGGLTDAELGGVISDLFEVATSS